MRAVIGAQELGNWGIGGRPFFRLTLDSSLDSCQGKKEWLVRSHTFSLAPAPGTFSCPHLLFAVLLGPGYHLLGSKNVRSRCIAVLAPSVIGIRLRLPPTRPLMPVSRYAARPELMFGSLTIHSDGSRLDLRLYRPRDKQISSCDRQKT